MRLILESLPIFIRVGSLAQGQSYDCPSASEATLKNRGKMNQYQTTTKREWFAYYMMTSPNGNIFRVTGHLCGEFTGPGEFPSQRPVTRTFDVYFDLRLNKQSWGSWFETLSSPLWRHSNVMGCTLSSVERPRNIELCLRGFSISHDLNYLCLQIYTVWFLSLLNLYTYRYLHLIEIFPHVCILSWCI